jgi:hypothetical protein
MDFAIRPGTRRLFGVRPTTGSGANPEPGRLRRFIIDDTSRHGRLGTDHSLWGRSERVHALSNGGSRYRSVVLLPELVDCWDWPQCVSPFFDDRGDGDVVFGFRTKPRPRHGWVALLAGARRGDGAINGLRQPERHAAQLRISILPAAEPAPAFVDWRGNVVNVTAHGLSDRAKVTRAICLLWDSRPRRSSALTAGGGCPTFKADHPLN